MAIPSGGAASGDGAPDGSARDSNDPHQAPEQPFPDEPGAQPSRTADHAPPQGRSDSSAELDAAQSPRIRLLLADDHPVVRAGLRAVLEGEPDFRIVAEAGTAEEAVELVNSGRGATEEEGDVDVVLMDLQFGSGAGMNGSQATAAITARPGAPRVLVVTTYGSDADTLPALEAGATGYLLKDAPPEELAAAVRAAAAGRSTLAPAVADRLLHRMRAPEVSLSRRETEVLGLVADGLTNLEISRRLHLSQATVKSHLVHIYAKLEVESRTAAVAVATERGLIRR